MNFPPRRMASLPEDLGHFPTNLAYVAGSFYGLVLSMVFTLIPLYLLDLGYGAAEVGIVVSTQGIFQVLLQFAGGVVSDRFGERVVIGFSFAAVAAGVVAIVISPLFIVLIAAQLMIGASRSVYWIAGQSYVSRSFEARPGTVLGRLLSFESGGIAVGGVVAGVEIAAFGFNVAFLTCAVICGLGLVAVVVLPELPRQGTARSLRASLAPVPGLLRSRPIAMAGIIAFAASMSAALVSTVYPVYFVEVGFGEAFIGGLRSINAIGIIAVAFSFGAVMAVVGQRSLIAISLVLTGVFTIATAVVGGTAWAAVLVILAVGGTFGVLRAVYPAIGAGNSIPEQRGVALSVVALYWALGQLLVPVTFGFIAEYRGTVEALWIGGGLLMALGVVSPLLYKWLLAPSAKASKAADAASPP